jgi:hypothetical protein
MACYAALRQARSGWIREQTSRSVVALTFGAPLMPSVKSHRRPRTSLYLRPYRAIWGALTPLPSQHPQNLARRRHVRENAAHRFQLALVGLPGDLDHGVADEDGAIVLLSTPPRTVLEKR